MSDVAEDNAPAYRQFWFWMVFGPLLFIIFFSMVTVYIALKGADDVVTDNYYKSGLAINKTLHQDEKAAALRMSAKINFDVVSREVTLVVTGDAPLPPSMILFLDNPVKKALDQFVVVREVTPGNYRGELAQTLEHSWYLALVPVASPELRKEADWLLTGDINLAKTSLADLKSRAK